MTPFDADANDAILLKNCARIARAFWPYHPKLPAAGPASVEHALILHSGLKSSGSDEGTNDNTPVCVRAAFAAPVDTTGPSSRMGKCELVK